MMAGLARMATAQATTTPPSSYNQQEREAVEVVKGWIGAWRAYDVEKLMSYTADGLVFRADPSEPLQQGRAAIDELFVTGTEWDTAVLIKRADGIATFFRVKNRRITEWLDVATLGH